MFAKTSTTAVCPGLPKHQQCISINHMVISHIPLLPPTRMLTFILLNSAGSKDIKIILKVIADDQQLSLA